MTSPTPPSSVPPNTTLVVKPGDNPPTTMHKFFAALGGAVVLAVLNVLLDVINVSPQYAMWSSFVVALITAVTVYAVPNRIASSTP